MGFGSEISSTQIARDNWAGFVPSVSQYYRRIVYFSYSINPIVYTKDNTYESIWGSQIEKVYKLIDACKNDYGLQTFDIVGHSMGGVVLSEYMKKYALSGPQAGLVRHAITLDSPVNGALVINLLMNDSTRFIADWQLPILTALWGKIDRSIVSAREMADMYEVRKDVYLPQNESMVRSLFERGIVFRTYSNCDDFAILEADAKIETAGFCFPLERSGVNPNYISGHDQIKDLNIHPEVRAEIQAYLSYIPQAPSLSASPISQNQIDLTWQSSYTDISDYHIERSPNGTSNWIELGTVSSGNRSFSNTGLTCGTTYYYRVRAHRHSDNQYYPYSNIASTSTSACNSTCFNLNVVANPIANGSVSRNPAPNCNGTQYLLGTNVTLTPNPNYGYSFGLWSGDATGSSYPIVITMNGSKNITANFIRPYDTTPPTVSWVSPSNGQTINSQTLHLEANASDNASGINRVAFSAKWGGQWHSVATVYSAAFAYDWDMCGAGVPDGDVELGLEVWDNNGNPYYYSQHFTNYHITKNRNCNTQAPPTPAGWQRDQNCGTDGVTLYEFENYQGACLHTSGSAYSSSLRDYSFNDIASSVRIVGNWTLYLFEHDNKGGGIKTIDADVTNLAGWTFDNTASSADVKPRGSCKHIGLGKSPDLPGGISRTPEPNCGDGYLPGTTVQLQFIPDANANVLFGYWGGNASGTSLTSSVYVMDESWAIANLVQCLALNTSLNPSGGGSIQASPSPNCGTGYESGTTVTLVASPNTGYAFGSWSNQASGTISTAILTMDADKTTVANFVPSTPSDLRIANTTPYAVSITWQDNSVNENSFQVYRWNGNTYVNIGSTGPNTSSFTNNGLTCGGTDYYYLVAAVNSVGSSQLAGSIKGTTSSCPSGSSIFGNGQDGDLIVTTNTDVNPIRASTSGTVGSNVLTISNITGGGFQTNQLILIHQSRGSSTGSWEFNTVQDVGSGQLTLKSPLVNSYVTDGGTFRAQVVWVPQYHDLTLNNGVTVSPTAWDGNTGGIVTILAQNSVLVNGTITSSGRGYRGGAGSLCGDPSSGEGYGGGLVPAQSVTNHSGGGGVNSSAGGGGGNGTIGGNSIYRGSSIGGTLAGAADLQSMFFGGGGGGGENCQAAGSGGRGGGIILIYAQSMVVNGSIVSNGDAGQSVCCTSAKAGGGGAGGSILLKGNSLTLGTNIVTASGGSGGIGGNPTDGANGGAGGVGRIRIEYCDFSGTTNPSASTQKMSCASSVSFPFYLPFIRR
jgi:hypothetical protein